MTGPRQTGELLYGVMPTSTATCCGSGTLMGVHRIDWIAEKIADVTPTPSASEITAKTVNTGADRKRRQPNRASRAIWWSRDVNET